MTTGRDVGETAPTESQRRDASWRPTRRASIVYFLWRLMLAERVKISRDTVLFALGVVILVYELTQAHPPSDALITVGGGFAGAPLFLRFDERQVYRRRRRVEEDDR